MEVISITDIGRKRSANEDSVFASLEPIGLLPNLFIVADGMGGHNAGEVASSFCVDFFVNRLLEIKSGTPVDIIKKAIESTNKELLHRANSSSEFMGMGTTFVVATIIDNTLYVANVGDSRLYTIGSVLKQITEDHSLVEIMVKTGEIDKEEAKTHPKKNIITRALGANHEVYADFFEVSLEDISYILMCTDGLTNMVDDNEIMDIISNLDNVEKAAQTLITQANNYGGIDNIGIVLISVKKR